MILLIDLRFYYRSAEFRTKKECRYYESITLAMKQVEKLKVGIHYRTSKLLTDLKPLGFIHFING